MTEPTIWPARRVGDEFRCGRVVDGRQRCPGVIAWVDDILPEKRALYEPGTVVIEWPGEDPTRPGIADATGMRHLRNTTRRRMRRGHSSRREWIKWPVADFPFSRTCPVCASTARVDSAVLDSGGT